MCAGGCDCRAVRYRLTSAPMIVHCCHCRWCQRETGASFALNAVIEADRVVVESGAPEIIETPSASGKGQKIHRCPTCKLALWSNYNGAGERIHFVRVGTLDEPDRFPPDVPRPATLPAGARVFSEFYDPKAVWTAEAAQRWAAETGRG